MNPRISRYVNKDGQPTNTVLFYDMRSSFMHVFSTTYNSLSKKNEYSVDILIPKHIDRSEMDCVVADIITEEWGPRVPVFKYPEAKDRFGESMYLKDGDKKMTKSGEPYEGYPGHVYITAKSAEDQPPRVVDMARKDITNPSSFVSGQFGHFNVEFFTYDQGANQGIGFQVRSVMSTGEGAPFRGGMSPEEAIGVFEVSPDMMI